MHVAFDENPVTKSPYYSRNRRRPNEFTIEHFARKVSYVIDNFMDKNKDAISLSLMTQVNASASGILHGDDADPAEASASPAARGNSNKLTLAAKFKLDLDSLMSTLKTTTPNFVRCVKPNDQQVYITR